MRGFRSGFGALLAGVVVAGLVSVPPVAGTGVGSVGPAPQVVTAVPVSRAAVVAPMAKKKAKAKPTVVFTSTLKLVVDVNPDLPKSKHWKIKLQRKSGSKWRTVGVYRTQGATETRARRTGSSPPRLSRQWCRRRRHRRPRRTSRHRVW